MTDPPDPTAGGRIVRPDRAGMRRAAYLITHDSVCAFPTETVYGLGANVFSSRAVTEIYRLKQRPRFNPLIVHVSSVEQARTMVDSWPENAELLTGRFWPGPLTIVLAPAKTFPAEDIRARGSVAIRVPAHPVALTLLRKCQVPIAAPSANRSEGVSPTTAAHVVRSLPDVPLVIDGGPTRFGIESTVVDLRPGPPRLLRPGALPLVALRDAIGFVDLPGQPSSGRDGIASPGMSGRHYAPDAAVQIVDRLEPDALDNIPRPFGILTHELPDPHCVRLASHLETLSSEPSAYAADLYAALHRLDDAGVRTIVVQAPPTSDAWTAIRDRLCRASATRSDS